MARTLTDEIIVAAIDGFEAQKARIDQQISELRGLLSGGGEAPAEPAGAPAGRKRRRISAAGRARIAEAQRQRWAALKSESGEEKSEPQRTKRRLSPAGRRAIQEALRRRWAAKRAEAARTEVSASSKTASGRRGARNTARSRGSAKRAGKKAPSTKRRATKAAVAAGTSGAATA